MAANWRSRARNHGDSGGQPYSSCGLSLPVDKEIHFPGEGPSLPSHKGSTSARCATAELPPPQALPLPRQTRGQTTENRLHQAGNIKTTVKASQPGEWLQIQRCHAHFWKARKMQTVGTTEVPGARNSVKEELQLATGSQRGDQAKTEQWQLLYN